MPDDYTLRAWTSPSLSCILIWILGHYQRNSCKDLCICFTDVDSLSFAVEDFVGQLLLPR